ncbi:hypothetical protein NX059_007789 [Plenodomus lindquistii]|nr:hypothetical protein NX059_007789 [Plenodomus lindquistii]
MNPEEARIPTAVLGRPMDRFHQESCETSPTHTLPLSPPRRLNKPIKRMRNSQGSPAPRLPDSPDHSDDLAEAILLKQLPDRASTVMEDLIHKVKNGWQTMEGHLTEGSSSQSATPREHSTPASTKASRDKEKTRRPRRHFDDPKIHREALDSAFVRLGTMGHPSKLVYFPNDFSERATQKSWAALEATEQKCSAKEMRKDSLEKTTQEFEIVDLECDEEWEQITGEDGDWEVVERQGEGLYHRAVLGEIKQSIALIPSMEYQP